MSDKKLIQFQKLLESFEILKEISNTVVINEEKVQVNYLIGEFEDLIQRQHSTDLLQTLVEILHDIHAVLTTSIGNREE
jgi:hypothetical protein